jgi:iron complex transport system ATP-binding protein
MSDYVIEVNDLELKSGENYLLKDINWKVRKGEHWLVFGMNGSGKTTMLSILAGFKHKSGGTVRLFGQEFTEENILAIRKRIGWISASFFDQIYKNESVINIVLSGKFGTAGLDTGLIDNDYKLAAVLLKDLGIAEKAELPFKFLSKGERQNVLIARAFMEQPSVLLLDEPCSGLDIVAREKFLQTVMKLAERNNITIIYVTHYTEEILDGIFQKTLLLRDGLCYKQGETKELFRTEVMSDFLSQDIVVTENKPYGFKISID